MRRRARTNTYLDLGQQLPLWQTLLQLNQLCIAVRLKRPGVDALVHRPGVWESALPLHGCIHPTAVVTVLVYDVWPPDLVGLPSYPLGILNVQDCADSLPVPNASTSHGVLWACSVCRVAACAKCDSIIWYLAGNTDMQRCAYLLAVATAIASCGSSGYPKCTGLCHWLPAALSTARCWTAYIG